MGVIEIVLLVVFVVICVLAVSIILLQRDEGGGLGGLFGGGSSAFGSRSQTVITKTTYVFVALFFLTTIGLAVLNRASVVEDLSGAAVDVQSSNQTEGQDWLNNNIESTDEELSESNASETTEGEN